MRYFILPITILLTTLLTHNTLLGCFDGLVSYDVYWTGDVDDDWNNADNYTDAPTERDRIFIDSDNFTGNALFPKIYTESYFSPSYINISNNTMLEVEGELSFNGAFDNSFPPVLRIENQGSVLQNDGEISVLGNDSRIEIVEFGEYNHFNGRIVTNTLLVNENAKLYASGGEVSLNQNLENYGEIVMSGGDVYIYGNLINDGEIIHEQGNIYVYGDFTNNGAFTQLGGNIYFMENIHQLSGNNIFHNITVNAESIEILSGEQKIFGNLIIENGAINTNNLLTIASDENRTGSIGPIAPGTIQGEVKVERHISNNTSLSNDWRFLGSPIQGQTLENWNDNMLTSGFPGADYSYPGPNIMWYDETLPGTKDERWVTPSDISDPINEGQGYAVYMGSESIKVDVRGNIISGDFNFPVTYSNNMDEDNDGWNLVSNPYPSSIDWDSPEWIKENISDAIWIWNPSTGQFATYINGSGVNGGANLIASSQAFWIKATGNNPALTISENAKSLEDQVFLKNDAENNDMHITLSNGSLSDEIIIKQAEGATLEYNPQYDANNLGSYVSNVSLYSVIDNHQYAIKTIDVYNTSITEIEVAALSPQSGTFDLTFDNIEAFPMNTCIVLEDQFTGDTYDLRSTQQISVNLSDTTSIPRFKLSFIQSFDYDLTHVACHGDSTGQVTIDLDSDEWDITWTYQGEEISSENTVTEINAGTYEFNASNSSLEVCGTFSGQLTVEEPNEVEVVAEIQHPECAGETSGSINIEEVLNMGDTLTYEWANGESTNSLTDLSAGAYELTIINTKGCEHLVAFEIEEGLNIEAGFTTEQDTFLLSEESVEVEFDNISVNAETYLWDFGNNQTSNEANPVTHYYEAGEYEVTLTAVQNNCESIYQKTVTIQKDLTSIDVHNLDEFTIMQDLELLTLDIQLNQPERLSISLINTTGQQVKQFGDKEYFTDRLEVNTSNLSSGIYFLRVNYTHGNKSPLVFKAKL